MAGLTLQGIITEADTLVPNGYVDADKAAWLNIINNEFFDIVKIPKIYTFPSGIGLSEYSLPTTIRKKNIDLVMIGITKYRSLDFEDVQPTQNYYYFEEFDSKLHIKPAHYKSGDTGTVRFRDIATTTFTQFDLNIFPDAPLEYNWIYVFGLAELIAKANEEDEKAANYGGQYRNALSVAAQNYQKAAVS